MFSKLDNAAIDRVAFRKKVDCCIPHKGCLWKEAVFDDDDIDKDGYMRLLPSMLLCYSYNILVYQVFVQYDQSRTALLYTDIFHAITH